MANLTPELEAERKKICKVAKDFGLDCFETIFELITYDQINQFAAFGGFPVRYPHWKFGMEYEHLSKSYEYGLSKIYEMVINTDPCYAYLMEGNMMMDQKLVMAHVYGHCDFFKNNIWFSKTNRKMMDQMANHATRIRRYIDRYGYETVEDFIDVCLSLENLIDRYSPYVETSTKPKEEPLSAEAQSEIGLLKVNRPYMRDYINPPEFVREQRQKMAEKQAEKARRFPSEPQRDVLNFLLHYAPLEDWQQDVLSIIRDEAYYFAPQGMTKTMNEGWASYWHSKIMTQKILTDSEIIDFADHHSGTMAMAPNGYNPYKVGIELLRDIEERWDKGRFGREWEECDDVNEKKHWDRKTGLGRDKIFEVRRIYNDVTFIDEFLTEDFCVRNKLFVYKFNKRTNRFEIDTKDFKAIKAQLLFHMTNFGQPIIRIEDANFENRGELLLNHLHEGIDMQPDFMQATLKNVFKIWCRPVNLVTVMDNEPHLYRFDGQEYTQHKAGEGAP
ncbi:MAG TPA: SpoVR family protein [Pseudobdellovibrionaceae bacterium]|nr:SpoVR family protein [Pseudobdellovibrionaceae bacterium]